MDQFCEVRRYDAKEEDTSSDSDGSIVARPVVHRGLGRDYTFMKDFDTLEVAEEWIKMNHAQLVHESSQRSFQGLRRYYKCANVLPRSVFSVFRWSLTYTQGIAGRNKRL